jgi:hypothetical protein
MSTDAEQWSSQIKEKEAKYSDALTRLDIIHHEMRQIKLEIDEIKLKKYNHDANKHWPKKRIEWYPHLPFTVMQHKIESSSSLPIVLVNLVSNFLLGSVAIPIDYKIWSAQPGTIYHYHVTYNDIHMTTSITFDGHMPSYQQLIVNGPNLPSTFLIKVVNPTDITATLTKARELCPAWNTKWDFGLIMFHDWVRYFLHHEPGIFIWDELKNNILSEQYGPF